jgi:hypothetical protein
MLTKTRIMDDTGCVLFESQTEIDVLPVMQKTQGRVEFARAIGEHYTADAIRFFGAKFIAAARAATKQDELRNAAEQVVQVAWLYESVFCGVRGEAFAGSDLRLTLLPGGDVQYERSRAGEAGPALH